MKTKMKIEAKWEKTKMGVEVVEIEMKKTQLKLKVEELMVKMKKEEVEIETRRKRRKVTHHLATFMPELFNPTFSFLSQPDFARFH